MDRDYYGDENVAAEGVSPYVSKMEQYVDADRAIERMSSEARNLEKQIAEARAMQAKLRRDLIGYIDADREAAKASISEAMAR